MKNGRVISIAALCAALALIAYPLYAHCGKCAEDGKKIIAQLDQHKTTLAKIITAAEQHSKGRAVSVVSELTGDDHKLMVEVYCIASDKIQMCQVDPATGKVAAMKEVKEFPITEPSAPSGAAAAGGSVKMVTDQLVDAACGACIYKMSGVQGCPLAVMIDGKPYLVEGATWPNHDYCDRKCQAVVTGKLVGDKFIATELQPKS